MLILKKFTSFRSFLWFLVALLFAIYLLFGYKYKLIDERDKLIIEQREAMIDTEDEMHDLKTILSSQQAFIEKIILYLRMVGKN